MTHTMPLVRFQLLVVRVNSCRFGLAARVAVARDDPCLIMVQLKDSLLLTGRC